jgi:O-acetyl-ADP-ribose deacetylase
MTISEGVRAFTISGIQIVIGHGSVLDFEPSNNSSTIVNAANERCLGGGGVDGAITAAGGYELFCARMALPQIEGKSVRCLTGDAKLTGPGIFGTIKTNHVIHAVGPNYNKFKLEDYPKADRLLKSAYIRSLEIAHSARIKEVYFPLLSSGAYRAKKSQKSVLEIALSSINEWAASRSKDSSVNVVVLCCFTTLELRQLCELVDQPSYRQ